MFQTQRRRRTPVKTPPKRPAKASAWPRPWPARGSPPPGGRVPRGDVRSVDGRAVGAPEPARVWRYHKPAGLVTTHKDPKGRATVFDHLPTGLPRVISVGRLDLNTE